MRLRSVSVLAAALLFAACASSTPAADAPAPAPDAAPADGRLLRVGETLTGTIVESDPEWGDRGGFHLYRFEAREGDRLALTMTSEDFDTYLVVGDGTGGVFNPIAEDDDSGGMLDARIRFTAPRTGTFQVLAQGYAEYATGSYSISLQPMPELRPAVAMPITPGASVEGQLDDSDALEPDEEKHYDLYTFDAEAGHRYAIDMTSDAFDTYLIVGTGTGEAFEEITRNDDGAGSTDSRVMLEPETSATYAVRATSFNGLAGGAYTLTVREMQPRGPATVTPITFGQTISASLDDADQMSDDGSLYDVYTFRGTEGQRVGITMRSATLDSYLQLGEPRGPQDEFWGDYSDDDSGGDLDARIVATLWRDGEFHVQANSLYPDEVGSYTITLEELPEPGPVEMEEIEIGASVTGSLDPGDAILEDGSHYDVYTFSGVAGQRLRITLASDDFDAYLQFGPWAGDDVEITDTDDDSAGGESGLDAMLEITLPESGTYAIMANSLGSNEIGLYTVTIEEL